MIGRRDALATMGAAALAPAAVGAAVSGLALDTREGRMRAFMLMRGALDDRLVVGWLKGRYYGCVDGAMTPLFDLVSATFARYRPLGDGRWQGVVLEQAYFLDRTSGAWLRRFANPYTDRTVDVPTGGYPATPILFTADRAMQVPNPMPGMTLSTLSQPFLVTGDDVMTGEVTTGRIVPSGGGAASLFHESVGLHARLSDLVRPDARKVRCSTSYTSVKSWREWLRMGDHRGELVSTGQGLYGDTPDALPPEWRAAARQHRPELLTDPGKLLEATWRRHE